MHSASHSPIKPLSEQNQAGNKLLAVISFLRGILFPCITHLITHTLLGVELLEQTQPCLCLQHSHSATKTQQPTGQLQEILLMENRQKGLEPLGEMEALSATRLPWSTSTLLDRDCVGKQLAKTSPGILYLQHFFWKSCNSIHTGQVQQKLA